MDVVNPNYLNYMEQIQKNRKDIEKLYDQELSDIKQLNFKENEENGLQYANGKAIFQGKSTIIRDVNSENLEVESKVEIKISSGDDDIVIDAGEDNSTLEIHLDNETKLSIDFAESERQKSKNLLNPKFLTQGATVFANGSFSTDTNYVTTSQKINVEPNSQIVMSANIGIDLDAGFIFFNNGVYVGYAKGVSTTTVPSNANQVVLDFHATGITPQSITTPQLEYGSVATDYQPYNGAIVHEKDMEPILIYDKDTKNTIGGTAYTDGIPINNTNISNDFSSYKKVEIIGVNRNTPIISTIDLTLQTNDTYYYGSGGMSYNAPIGEYNQYYLFMACAISIDKTQLILLKAGNGDTVETTQKVIRIVGYK